MSNPTNAVWPLADDLNGQSQSGVVTLTGVEPIRFDDGLWLEDAATNYCRNPSAETNTTGWSGSNTAITRTTDHPFSGDYCFRCQRTSTGGWGTMYATGGTSNRPAAAAGDVWTVRVKLVATAGLTLRLNIGWASGVDGATGISESFATIVTTGGEQEVKLTATAPATTASFIASLEHRVGGTVGDYWLTDCWEFLKAAYAGSYTDGDQNGGDGFDWTATANASTSTRAASSAFISPADILTPGNGAIAFRVTPTIETGLEEIWGQCGVKGAGTDHLRWGRDASKHPFCEWSSNDAAYQRLTATETVNAGTAYDVYLGHTGTVTSLAVDAGTLQTGTRAAVSGDFSTGDLTLEASAGGVIYQPFATFDRTLTAKEIATLNGKNNWTMKVLAGNPYRNFQLRPY